MKRKVCYADLPLHFTLFVIKIGKEEVLYGIPSSIITFTTLDLQSFLFSFLLHQSCGLSFSHFDHIRAEIFPYLIFTRLELQSGENNETHTIKYTRERKALYWTCIGNGHSRTRQKLTANVCMGSIKRVGKFIRIIKHISFDFTMY